jgi:hypothetical protein
MNQGIDGPFPVAAKMPCHRCSKPALPNGLHMVTPVACDRRLTTLPPDLLEMSTAIFRQQCVSACLSPPSCGRIAGTHDTTSANAAANDPVANP